MVRKDVASQEGTKLSLKKIKNKKFRCLHFQFILITFEREEKTFAEAGHSMSNLKMRLKKYMLMPVIVLE